MPGVLTHVSVAIVGALIVYFIFRKKVPALAFVVGQIIPDAIKFGIPGLKLETVSYYKILQDPLFYKLNLVTHTIWTWLILFFVILIVLFVLKKTGKLDKEKFKYWFIVNSSFLLAIVVHLILDVFIIEKSYWI